MILSIRWPFNGRSFGRLFNYRKPQEFDPKGEIVQDPLLYEIENPKPKEVKMNSHVYLRHHLLGLPWMDKLPKGGVTFGFQAGVDSDDNEVLHISLAACSDKDNFDRKEGRKLADQRLDQIGAFLTVYKAPFDVLMDELKDAIPYHGLRTLKVLKILWRQDLLAPSENFEVDVLEYAVRKHLNEVL